MKYYTTIIKAISPKDGELKTYYGPIVEGISKKDAQDYCNNKLGYCTIVGELVSRIPTKKDSHKPDWAARIDYDKLNLN